MPSLGFFCAFYVTCKYDSLTFVFIVWVPFISFLFVHQLCFVTILRGTQGVFLPLHLWITPGKAQEILWCPTAQTLFGLCKASVLPLYYSFASPIHNYFPSNLKGFPSDSFNIFAFSYKKIVSLSRSYFVITIQIFLSVFISRIIMLEFKCILFYGESFNSQLTDILHFN